MLGAWCPLGIHLSGNAGVVIYQSVHPPGYNSLTLRHGSLAVGGRDPTPFPVASPEPVPKGTGAHSMIAGGDALARLPDGPPLLQVVVDTEEEFDWNQPFDSRNTSVQSIEAQGLAQALYAPYGLRPSYVIDYPVATTRSAIDVLKSFQDAGECQIGAHLHPWVNPPFDEEVNDANSYPGNLPAELEAAKLRALTEAIEASFGRRPTMYKAGRYGVGRNTAGLLRTLGYRIDLSVVPHTDFRPQHGPDFRRAPDRPYWFAEAMLEIPLSRGFSGLAARSGVKLFQATETGWGHRLRLAGILSKTRLLERATLSPEGITFDEIRRLVRSMLRRGHRLFTMTYHSPSLAPGHTPYVRSAHDLTLFMDTIRRILALFFEELAAEPVTPEKVLAMTTRQHGEA